MILNLTIYLITINKINDGKKQLILGKKYPAEFERCVICGMFSQYF